MIGQCKLCGRWGYAETHHIFGGANRRKSDRHKLTVSLCVMCHREGKHAVHRNAETMQQLHEYGQKLWMQRTGGTVEDFRRLFGKNYLEDDAPVEAEELPRGDFGEFADALGF